MRRDLLEERRWRGADAVALPHARQLLAVWTGRAGDRTTAAAMLEPVHAEQRALLGADDPVTLRTLVSLGHNVAQGGDQARSRDLVFDAYTRQRRRLGDDDPDTLRTGWVLAVNSPPADAVPLLRGLVPAQAARLGLDHPHTLDTRFDLAVSLAGTGQHRESAAMLTEAYRLARDLVADHVRVLGPDHPDTRLMRELPEAKARDARRPAAP